MSNIDINDKKLNELIIKLRNLRTHSKHAEIVN